MPRYCKAYKLEELRKFPKWAEAGKPAEKDLKDDAIVYVKEDFSVTTDCLDLDNDDAVIYADLNEEWSEFCKNDLGFLIPDWEEEARIVREQLEKEEAAEASS